MTKKMHFSCRFTGINFLRGLGIFVVLMLIMSAGSMLMADPAPIHGDAPAKEDFGQYLVDHSADLAPFFNKNLEDLVRKAMPMVLGLLAWILMFSLLAGFVVDVLLARGFTPFFAPAHAKLPRAVFYSVGRFVLSLLVLALLALTVFATHSLLHAGIIILFVGFILALVTVVTQVGWLAYVFRMNIGTSVIFYVIILGAQALTFILVATPILVGKPSVLAYRFVNETMTPELEEEVDATKHDLADVQKSVDETKAKIADLKNRIAQAQANTDKLNKQIDAKQASEPFLFQKITKLEAQGDLQAAHDQFTAMLAKYPSGTMSDAVKTHLTQVDSEIATQDAQKKQAEADALAAAAAARADLLARAGRGEVTLSEMRQVLAGKSRQDVTALFGPPTDTASDRWGYGQQMIVNPMTKAKYGLTIYFTQGIVQSVDYYYGGTK